MYFDNIPDISYEYVGGIRIMISKIKSKIHFTTMEEYRIVLIRICLFVLASSCVAGALSSLSMKFSNIEAASQINMASLLIW